MMSMQISKELYPTVISRQLHCIKEQNSQHNIPLIWGFWQKAVKQRNVQDQVNLEFGFSRVGSGTEIHDSKCRDQPAVQEGHSLQRLKGRWATQGRAHPSQPDSSSPILTLSCPHPSLKLDLLLKHFLNLPWRTSHSFPPSVLHFHPLIPLSVYSLPVPEQLNGPGRDGWHSKLVTTDFLRWVLRAV